MSTLKKLAVGTTAALLLSGAASAGVLFTEDFESGLSAWTGKNNGAHNGQVVTDPLDATNSVLNWTALNSAGDTFTISTFSLAAGDYVLEYDYLGTCTSGNCGGFVGYSQGYPGSHVWLAGTGNGYPDLNPDNGQWNHVVLAFSTATTFHLMLEDFSGSGGVAGDAYFDNFVLRTPDVPAPAALSLLGFGIAGLGVARRRRSLK